MLFGRLVGQETEYAIRFSPELRHPGNDLIYEALSRAIAARVRTGPGMYSGRPEIFTQNGGAFHYEYYPYCSEGGLIEGATPECRGPAQLLLYQKAQEALLRKVIPDAERRLRSSGYPGKLGLLKNCRDAEGHIYGAQESFEADVARGSTLWLYRFGLAALLPLLALTVLVSWAIFIGLAVGVLVAAIAWAFALLLPPVRRLGWHQRFSRRDDHRLENALGRYHYALIYVVTWPFITAFSLVLRAFAFRAIRRDATAFLVTRCLVSGAGSVDDEGNFTLSEKGPATNGVMRGSIRPGERAIFDIGNLMKPGLAAAHLHLTPLAGLFRRRQRLQLGLADSCMLQEAEFLKIGATALVIDMVEQGYLRDAPRIRRPVAALHAVAADSSLGAEVPTDRGSMTALEIQRFYLERAKELVRQSTTTSIEAADVIRLWEECLVALEKRELGRLVGRVDWVTKRFLLESCSDGGGQARLKTIDLRYHELGEGYAWRLEGSGAAATLLALDEVERAIAEPPRGTPAFTRGRFIRTRTPGFVPTRISWESARVGGRLQGKVVHFPSPTDSEA